MYDVLLIAAAGLTGVALILLGAVLLLRRRAVTAFDRAYDAVPRNEETGLLAGRALLPRVQAEIKRAARTGGTLWLATVTVTVGESDRFGRLVNDSLRYPELGFQLADHVLCIIYPSIDPARRADLLGRLVAAAPREQLVIGEAVWRPGDPVDAAALLTRAGDAAQDDDDDASGDDHLTPQDGGS